MSFQRSVISDYQYLQNRLKKKRILKKPNIAEAGEQFESLAIRSEGSGYLQTAGLCCRSAARCAGSLGHTRQEANFLLRAGRLFLKKESLLAEDGHLTTEEDLQEAFQCYHEALDRIENEDVVKAGCIHLELGKKLARPLGKTEAAIVQMKKAAALFKNYPIERIECLREIMLLRMQQGAYEDAFKCCIEAVDTLEDVPTNGNKEHLCRDFIIFRLLLLLVVEPATNQVSKKDAQFLEKFTWIDSVDYNGELADLQSTLSSAGLGTLSPDLFLLLQSLVMVVQSCDVVNAISVESSLNEMINCDQSGLVRTLVRRLENKSM